MELTGPTKAAILLLSLSEEKTVSIIEQFNEQEVRKLKSAVDQMQPVSADVLEQVYADFNNAFKEGVSPVEDRNRYLQDLVRKAQGEEQAARYFLPEPAASPELESPLQGKDCLATLTEVDPFVLRSSISAEHPQVAAAVLAHLPPETAAEVLGEMESEKQSDLIFRISTLEPLPVTAFSDAAMGLKGIDPRWIPDSTEVDGVQMAATILNEMPGTAGTDLLEILSEEHPEDVAKLQRAMFTMEDLAEADTRGVQELLKEVQTDTLLVALKTASDPLRDKIFSCMSKRAGEMLQEEAELLPPMRLAEIESAQDQIVEIAMRLLAEGKMSVKGKGDELV
jgi:flagellar motor switch protein FliG